MAKLTDLSQLSRNMIKPVMTDVKPAPSLVSKADEETAAVLAYFSRRPQASAATVAKAAEAVPATDNSKQQLDELSRRLKEAESTKATAESALAKSQERLQTANKELLRLQGECSRLQGELNKLMRTDEVDNTAAQTPLEPVKTKVSGLLTLPGGFEEVFPGELRELVIAALANARDGARQGGKDRRAVALDAVLAANGSSGELDRRREALKQALKDSGYTTNPSALESLGFRLISGRTHWKLQYANIRLAMAKTPSDFRSTNNTSTEITNRCF